MHQVLEQIDNSQILMSLQGLDGPTCVVLADSLGPEIERCGIQLSPRSSTGCPSHSNLTFHCAWFFSSKCNAVKCNHFNLRNQRRLLLLKIRVAYLS